MSVLAVDSDQILAYRLAGHHLHRRTPAAIEAVAACGIQEYPPGWSGVALHARTTGTLNERDVVTVNAMRGAPHIVPRRDARIFTAALVPQDNANLKALVGTRASQEAVAAGLSVREALDQVAAAAREGLASGPLERDDFHQALRERLPEGLLPWCRGCKSHHVRPGFWRALGPLEVTHMPAKATWALVERPPKMTLEDAQAELARRFLRCYGPATHSQLASWAQTAPAHAKALFARLNDELERTSEGIVLAEDTTRLEDPPAATGIRLLGGHDPYVVMPDRLIAPDKALRGKLFPAVGRPGVVLHDGVLSGLWRGRKQKDVLEIEVDWIGDEADIAAEAAAVAPLRGCQSARVLA